MRDVHAFHAGERNICWCAASCPRNPNWVTTTPSAAASSSWNQELPTTATPHQIRANAVTARAIRLQ
jgi:hypothetical protein